MTDATDEARRQANYETYRKMRTSQNGGDRAGWLDCFTDDVVFEAPYYREDGAPLASGRDAMARVFDRMKETFSSVNYQVKRFIPAVDPDLVIVEVRGDNAVANSDKRYQNDYLFLVQCRDGKIAHIFEYSNPMVYKTAVG
jgi:ketosteroid isomerase-like protein